MLHFGSWGRVRSAMPNNKKSPEDESFVSVRAEEVFVRPLGGRHSRECAISSYAYGV